MLYLCSGYQECCLGSRFFSALVLGFFLVLNQLHPFRSYRCQEMCQELFQVLITLII